MAWDTPPEGQGPTGPAGNGASHNPVPPGGGGGGATTDQLGGMSPSELFAIAGSLNSTVDLDHLLDKISKTSERMLDSEASSIMLLDDAKQNLFFKTARGAAGAAIKKLTLPVGKGIAGTVAKNRTVYITNDPYKDPLFNPAFDKATGFVTRCILCVPMFFRGDIIGIMQVLNKKGRNYTDADQALLTNLANMAAVAIMNTRLVQEQKNFFSHVLEIMAMAIESSKPRYVGHPARASMIACTVARAFEVDKNEYQAIYYAGLLHDIGYVGIKNPGVLEQLGLAEQNPSPEVLEEMHPVIGATMLEPIRLLEGAIPIIRAHHERHDGGGPLKLKGDQIPMGARILKIVETIEELRIMAGLTGEELKKRAMTEMQNGSGTRFDPAVVSLFLELADHEEKFWA